MGEVGRKFPTLRGWSNSTACGCSVKGGGDAKGVLRILTSDKSIDLMFSDIVMPGGVDEKPLAGRSQKFRPRLKVLLTTGFAEKAGEESFGPALEAEISSRPVRQHDLA